MSQIIHEVNNLGELVVIGEEFALPSFPRPTIMTSFIAQKALTGITTFVVTAAGIALPGPDAKAAPLIFDCYSRSTSDLLMKSALDLSNPNLACVQVSPLALGVQPVVSQPVIAQPVYAAPTAVAPSAGESFFGSVIGGALGGVIGNALRANAPTREGIARHRALPPTIQGCRIGQRSSKTTASQTWFIPRCVNPSNCP